MSPFSSNHFTSPLGFLSLHTVRLTISHVVGPGPDHRNKSNEAPTSWHNRFDCLSIISMHEDNLDYIDGDRNLVLTHNEVNRCV